MSKPLSVTPEMKAELIAEFTKYLDTGKLTDGKVSFNRNYHYPKDKSKVRVHFTTSAYLKMCALIDGFSSEVAWHGIVDRQAEDLFVITDILVYPQKVTGVTVNTDQEAYVNWMDPIEPEVFNAMRMQGHSHVNMAVFPSGDDLAHQGKIISQLSRDDDYYIFMIWNKSMKHNISIYDMSTNTMYEDKDIIVTMVDQDLDLEAFMAGARKMVTTTYVNYSGGVKGYQGSSYSNPRSSYSYPPYDDEDDVDYDEYTGGYWKNGVFYAGGLGEKTKKSGKSEKKESAAGSGAKDNIDYDEMIADMIGQK